MTRLEWQQQRQWGDAMDQNSLVIDQFEAGARFLGEFQKYVPVKAAFWLKESAEGNWILYIYPKNLAGQV